MYSRLWSPTVAFVFKNLYLVFCVKYFDATMQLVVLKYPNPGAKFALAHIYYDFVALLMVRSILLCSHRIASWPKKNGKQWFCSEPSPLNKYFLLSPLTSLLSSLKPDREAKNHSVISNQSRRQRNTVLSQTREGGKEPQCYLKPEKEVKNHSIISNQRRR